MAITTRRLRTCRTSIVVGMLATLGSPAFAQVVDTAAGGPGSVVELGSLAALDALPAATRLDIGSAPATPRITAPAPAHITDPQPRRSVWNDLFLDTGRDFRNLPSRQTLGWLAIGAAAAASTRPADSHVGRSLSNARMLEEPLEPGAVIGSTPLQLGLSAATYAFGRAAGWPRLTTVGADLFRAELVAQALTMGMKEGVRRRRPEGAGFAFPSGHTTVSFASATVLQQHLGWRMGAPAYALASYVALSRVQMKRHYLSDVAFGAALGIAAGRTITFGSRRQLRVEPMAAPGGGGIQFSLMPR